MEQTGGNNNVGTCAFRFQTEGSKNKSFKKRLRDFSNISVMHNIGQTDHTLKKALNVKAWSQSGACTRESRQVKRKFSLQK